MVASWVEEKDTDKVDWMVDGMVAVMGEPMVAWKERNWAAELVDLKEGQWGERKDEYSVGGKDDKTAEWTAGQQVASMDSSLEQELAVSLEVPRADLTAGPWVEKRGEESVALMGSEWVDLRER
jgi:hypothetical protein